MKLVLFDIDGTILSGGGAGRRALHRALIDVFGNTGPADHRFDGKTDPQIVRELMRLSGFTDAHIDASMPAVLRRYLDVLPEELSSTVVLPARALPGVIALLDAVEARPDAALGLLTGNLREGAGAKLRAVGIDPTRFVVGAFGSDHEHRTELAAVAQRRLRETRGIALKGNDIVIIGDTPSDITCGRSIGVRAIGVATGQHSFEELSQHGAAHVLPDLSDTALALAAIFD